MGRLVEVEVEVIAAWGSADVAAAAKEVDACCFWRASDGQIAWDWASSSLSSRSGLISAMMAGPEYSISPSSERWQPAPLGVEWRSHDDATSHPSHCACADTGISDRNGMAKCMEFHISKLAKSKIPQIPWCHYTVDWVSLSFSAKTGGWQLARSL